MSTVVSGLRPSAPRVDPDEIDGLLAEGATLPAIFYTDPDIAELEDELIFRPSWQIVAVEPELRNVGDSVTTDISGANFTVPVVVRRDEDRQLRAFGQPHLVPLSVDTWKGYVFVALTPRQSLAEALGEFPDVLEEAHFRFPFAPENVRDDFEYRRMVVENPVASNWKVFLENSVECYHCPTTHTHSFSSVYKVDPEHYAHREFDRGIYHSTWYQDDVAARLTMEGEREEPEYRFNWLWPNHMVGGGHRTRYQAGFSRIVPRGVHDCVVKSARFRMPEAEGYYPSAEIESEIMEAQRLTGVEDREVSARVQRGLRSGMYTYGYTLPESERNMRHVYRLVWSALAPAFRR